ncbi:putative bifunctional diguanylate cyclase/phosphodiesterase [Thalassoroseus pseudoceratinae]|uniref:putative bifunctional diguanylate cyclase/phosphodiesterase n=1 Tax=Thalassoroseus pseudoceratinae TaxID=2713176 RepID=UPI00142004FC|nr:EAL domain-containing protein [Thalassoroseus pseudoceratinae]
MPDCQGNLIFVDCSRQRVEFIDSLATTKIRVTTVPDGTDIERRIARHHTDAVILDHQQLADDTLDVIHLIRRSRNVAELSVIVITENTQPETQVSLFDAGANDVIVLPVATSVFVSRVRQQLNCVKHANSIKVSEARYALANFGSNDGLWDWNLQSNTVYFFPRWKEMLGYSGDEIGDSPQEWFSRIHPEDLPYVQDALSRHLAGEMQRFECEHRISHQDDVYHWMLARGVAVHDEAGSPVRIAGSLTDITRGKAADPVTGLPNRILFTDRLETAWKASKEDGGKQFAILFLDLDRFKFVNDSLGHHAGDELLVAVANRLEMALRAFSRKSGANCGVRSMLARFGGDEFVILLSDIQDTNIPAQVADTVLEKLAKPVWLEGHEVEISASVGVSLGSERTKCLESLLRDADSAMYHAKSLGKGRSCIFHPSMRTHSRERFALEVDLRKVVERGEYELQYQPIVDMETGAILGFEALARWSHPVHGMISPNDFIPVAEETGSIVKLGLWTLNEACRQLATWRREFPEMTDLFMAVNVSSLQFADPALVRIVLDSLEEHSLECHDLKLEITESTIMLNPDVAAQSLMILYWAGVRVCIDDFGTGHSSLSYLQRFPINTVKIDRSFVRRMTQSKQAIEIVKSIIDLAHNLDMDVTAEGIEFVEQHEILRELGCELGQGFYYSRPRSVELVADLLQKKTLLQDPLQIPLTLPVEEIEALRESQQIASNAVCD